MSKPGIISWTNGQLEIRGKRYIYTFERLQIFNIFLLVATISLASYFLISYILSDRAEVLWNNGNVQLMDGQTKQWYFLRTSSFPASSSIKIENKEDSPEKTESTQSELPRAALRYRDNVSVILTEGALIKKNAISRNNVDFTVDGLVYFTIKTPPKKESYQVVINDLVMQMNNGTLMHYHNNGVPTLNVIEGDLSLSPKQAKFIRFGEDQAFENDYIKLSTEQSILFKEEYLEIVQRNEEIKNVRQETYMPGFDQKGVYQPFGLAHLSEGTYRLVRNGQTYLVTERQVPIMFGDVLINESESRILLRSKFGDLLRLYPDAELWLPTADNNWKKPPLLMIVKGQDKISSSRKHFAFNGRLRVKINPIENRKISFRSSVAMIAVKGTDFEIQTNEQSAENLVVSGLVGFGDPEGKEAVDIKRGFMSQMEAGQIPKEPFVIPPERFKELLQDGFESQDKPSLLDESLELNKLSIKSDRPLQFQWNKSIQAANIVLEEKTYPLQVVSPTDSGTLTRDTLKDLVAGKYKARLEAQDEIGNWGEVDIELSILPEKDLSFFCDPTKRNYTKEEIEAIKAFQSETRIRVDGIIGQQTRGKIREMLNCEI